jgi:hypothetical protein
MRSDPNEVTQQELDDKIPDSDAAESTSSVENPIFNPAATEAPGQTEAPKTIGARLRWTQIEEDAFAQIMRVGHLDRLSAIRLYRRSASFERALIVAKAEAPTEAELARHKAFGEMAKTRAVMRSKVAHIGI